VRTERTDGGQSMWFLFYFLLLLGLADLVWRERAEEILVPWEGKTSAGKGREKIGAG